MPNTTSVSHNYLSKLNVLGAEYLVVDRNLEGSGIDGLCEPTIRVIAKHKDLTSQRDADVVLHEVMHAICRESGWTYRKTEEDYITLLASGLAQVFNDNPHLSNYLREQLASC